MLNAFNSTHSLSLKKKGEIGELLVVKFLERNNYTILKQNYLCKEGEVDIIAKRGDIIAFIEVKMRTETNFDLSEVITYGKQLRITRATHKYITTHSEIWNNFTYRFDVALVELDNTNSPITYIEDAFRDTLS
ncbi:MAG TPA: YraN family protein [Candidatus Babeliales bacterium]|nr:YraN family protein [Candidatus Babeliales bacterium]